jgi:hypothetical protein
MISEEHQFGKSIIIIIYEKFNFQKTTLLTW